MERENKSFVSLQFERAVLTAVRSNLIDNQILTVSLTGSTNTCRRELNITTTSGSNHDTSQSYISLDNAGWYNEGENAWLKGSSGQCRMDEAAT
jgi:hypothetical protein